MDQLTLTADVLVLGGGMAGAWAAAAAAQAGARVVLADKGYCGTSGVTATAGPGHWWVPPDPEKRAVAIAARAERGQGLADSAWMARVIEETWQTLPTLARYYTFPRDEKGEVQYRALRGPEYMRALRQQIVDLGVVILDHSPALELLRHGDGSIAGARGWRRQEGRYWQVRAGGTVLATGGCAFLSGLLGAHTNTGDGLLMAAEAGADFSGMEFSTYHTVAPAFSNMTRSMSYAFARYFDGAGRELDINPMESTRPLALALMQGPVTCCLDRMPQHFRDELHLISPNVMLPFVRKGIDPYRQRFPITLHGEGTIRGVGGVRLTGPDCATAVPGLFAAGDAATRENVAGATSGGGAQNSAWALSSGRWAGQAAAERARRSGVRAGEKVEALGRTGLRPRSPCRAPDRATTIAAVQGEMLPYDKILFRRGAVLDRSLALLDGLWDELGSQPAEPDPARSREAAALVAVARWCNQAALARRESRGLHERLDYPTNNPQYARRLVVGGLGRLWGRWQENGQGDAR
ncbi:MULTISPECIES: FAD-binding protein [unclassified Azospirillum]|uniref:FAD-dependent oxidoreductase n=1 Tax=unclassified Azospirillum TaxID=2630922 RepID=UPI000B6C1644|nr:MULTISPECIES: FAD-binding protein [unclassified Azospirillum]SNT22860.1 Succinate dehydrogenase/fumarate reductase, flavoprotein subunit [Azospirillum sp. RU38E]SNT34095.1 Succinate dehydrogenase/fumarate reductase, flavoprotein subunit [Azospirillum sp. RU37A]